MNGTFVNTLPNPPFSGEGLHVKKPKSHAAKSANKLKPDIIVCTGEYAHKWHAKNQVNEAWEILSKLRAKHGVYSVLDNHDHWADTALSIE